MLSIILLGIWLVIAGIVGVIISIFGGVLFYIFLFWLVVVAIGLLGG